MYRQERMRILIVIIKLLFLRARLPCDGQESALTNFWVTHPPSYQEPSNIGDLRQLGVDNPNSLVPYLKVNRTPGIRFIFDASFRIGNESIDVSDRSKDNRTSLKDSC